RSPLNPQQPLLLMNPAQGGGEPPPNPVLSAYNGWAGRTPFMSRSIMISLVVTFIITCFSDLERALSNTLYFTIFHFEIYRLVTANLFSSSLLSAIFGLLSFSTIGPSLEYAHGSAGLLVLIMTLDLVANTAFLMVMGLMYTLGYHDALFAQSAGFWNIIMPLIAVECMKSPDTPRKFFIFPCNIPSKFYPLGLFALFSLLGGFRMDMAIAMGCGYAYALGKLERITPSTSRLQGWETGGCLSGLASKSGYVTVGASGVLPVNDPSQGGGAGSWLGGGGGQQQQQQPPQQQDGGQGGGGGGGSVFAAPGRAKAPSIEAFQGSGRALGGGSGGGGGTIFSRSSSTEAPADPAAARAARLAAIESRAPSRRSPERGGSQTVTDSSSLLGNMDEQVLSLQDMGYSRDQAVEALRATNGDLTAAVGYLNS
ncbi:unnamed protein product, partial [Chrysoparadoxa australica]